MDTITIDDFVKVELKVGTIIEVGEIEGSEKLLKLKVDFGPKDVIPSGSEESVESEIASEDSPRNDEERDIRQVLSGIKKWYSKENLEGTQAIFVANLAPRMMMGMESQAMIMATQDGEDVILLRPEKQVPPGSKIR